MPIREEQNLAVIRNLIADIYDRHRAELMTRYYFADLEDTDPRGDLGQFIQDLRHSIPRVRVAVDLALADHDQVMAFVSWTGRGTRGVELKLYTSELFQLENGKVRTHGAVVDYCELGEFGFAPQRSSYPSRQDLCGSHSAIERENARIILASYSEVMSQHLLDRADFYYAQDYLHHNFQMPAVPNGVKAFKEYFAGNFRRYPDLTVGVDHILARRDRVMVFATWQGTFTGRTHGREPTGKRLHMRTSDLFRLENGKVVEHWEVVDYSGLLGAGIPIRSPHHASGQ